MRHSHSNKNGKPGRAILIAVLLALFIVFIGVAASGIFGRTEQFSRVKDFLSIVVSLITPLLTANLPPEGITIANCAFSPHKNAASPTFGSYRLRLRLAYAGVRQEK